MARQFTPSGSQLVSGVRTRPPRMRTKVARFVTVVSGVRTRRGGVQTKFTLWVSTPLPGVQLPLPLAAVVDRLARGALDGGLGIFGRQLEGAPNLLRAVAAAPERAQERE